MVTSIRRRVSILVCTIATAMLGAEFTLFGQNARAQIDVPLTPLLLCATGMETDNYNPGLTNQERQTTVNINGYVSGCTNIQENPITSGSYSFTFSNTSSCTVLGSFDKYTITYNWDTKESSVVEYISNKNVKANGETIITSDGIVRSGRFAGKPAQRILIIPTTDLTACSSSQGLTQLQANQIFRINPF